MDYKAWYDFMNQKGENDDDTEIPKGVVRVRSKHIFPKQLTDFMHTGCYRLQLLSKNAARFASLREKCFRHRVVFKFGYRGSAAHRLVNLIEDGCLVIHIDNRRFLVQETLEVIKGL